VLELSDAAGFPAPGNGKVVRVRYDGTIEDVATGLSVPTAMTFGPDGKLYVSNWGAAPAGKGQIVKITIW
jgi:sugar lactone lactonase YvrE